MANLVQGFNTENGIAKYDYNSLANIPPSVIPTNGKDGKDGKDGVNGKDGKDGVNGIDGKDGVNGVDGKDGKDGKDGANGVDGKDGLSAYEIACKNGFAGSESDWLVSLKGTAALSDDEKDALSKVAGAKNLTFDETVFTKTVDTTGTVISLDNNYMKSIIDKNQISLSQFIEKIKKDDVFRQLVQQFVADFLKDYNFETTPMSLVYDVLTNTASYTSNDPENDWYNFDNIDAHIIVVDEPNVSTAPVGTPNFGEVYLPSYTMELAKPLNLNATPYLNISYFTLNQCPFNLKMIDVNGHVSQPILIGLHGNNTNELWVNSNSHQELGSTGKLTAANCSGYTEYKSSTTKATIDDAITALTTEFNDNGGYNEAKCYCGSLNILSDMDDGITFEDEFDLTNITKFEVQCVETYDKPSISWKQRYKAFVWNKLSFSETPEYDAI